MSSPFDIKSVYSFDVYPSSILGTSFQNVTILSIMDYETALSMGVDVAATHVNVYPFLPNGTPDDPAATDYVRIQTASGAKTILGMSWINLSTIESITARIATVVIDGVTGADITNISNALVQNGFNNFTINLN